MNEKKKLIIVSAIIVAFIALISLIYVFNKPAKTDLEVIYIGRPTCGYCTLFRPGLDYISEKYDVKFTYLNADDLTETELSAWLEKLEIAEDEYGTPYTVITKGGVKIAENAGFLPTEDLFEFFQKNGVIASNVTFVSQYPNLTSIDLAGYKEMVASDSKDFVVLTQATCSACMAAKPYLEEIAKENDIEFKYYDLLFTTQEDYDYFYNSYSYIKKSLDEETLSTPTFIVVENGEVIDDLVGFEDKDTVVAFLKENGFIK